MDVFILIVTYIMFPIFFTVGLGMFLHRKFNLDLQTLSKLSTYFLLPAVCFTNIYQGDITFTLLGQIIFFLLLNTCLLIVISIVLSKINRFEGGLAASFKNSIVLSNAGNFGIPVSQLVFHQQPIGLSIAIIVSAYQNIVTFTYGLFNSASRGDKGTDTFKEVIRQPIIYALIVAMILKWGNLKIPMFIWQPLESISNAFLAIALVTLGAQIAYLKIEKISKALLLSIVGKLILSPLVACLLIFILGLEGITAQALLIASSFPTSRNSALLALEYNNAPEFAAQAVLLTTILSSITVTIVVSVSTLLY
ncbi:putative permease [Bacillus mesophilus]|uniref:AEC family transporter n=1 Tax=Bacillus mesophilus TaxID=1808955 RepID=A0A6M0Q3A1_9BACI|nr:AEC family transporter [Bacillus mesophilus]MBM7660004.1 putative permease [Bacillus mesophilus]NEY70865.1 AEC family transporter [Bacillus mesophilus]